MTSRLATKKCLSFWSCERVLSPSSEASPPLPSRKIISKASVIGRGHRRGVFRCCFKGVLLVLSAARPWTPRQMPGLSLEGRQLKPHSDTDPIITRHVRNPETLAQFHHPSARPSQTPSLCLSHRTLQLTGSKYTELQYRYPLQWSSSTVVSIHYLVRSYWFSEP